MSCFHCSNCCKSSKDPTSDIRRKGTETNGCFCCKRSSKQAKDRTRGVCGVGCFFVCESTTKDGSSGAESWRCFPRKKPSHVDEESSGTKKKKKGCFHCLRFCKNSSSSNEKRETASCFNCCNVKSSKASEEEVAAKKSKKKLKEKRSRKRGKKVMCCCGSCCSKSLEGTMPTSKSSCDSILNSLCCVHTSNGDSFIRKRNKGFCLRWKKKQKEEKGNRLVTLVNNMSFKSDDEGKKGFNEEEILRLGKINIASRVFTYKELLAATNNFKADCLLGSGGFGRVYKGLLTGTNEVIAVKKLDRRGYQGSREFLIEVLMLGLLQHPNLVKLLGYCAEGDQRILVYEYMPNGSVHDQLFDELPRSKPLDWFTRMKIATGAAKGLEHLHDVVNPPVIYRDMKASNILLDEDYNPKLSDFGLAKLGPVGDKTHVSTRVMGTYGYCAPEYALTGQLTKMSDVYSFGVLLLELITGRKAIDLTRPKPEQHLAHWAARLFKDKKKLVGMADPILEGKFPKKGLHQALAVADMCLQHEAATRPLISDVVSAIEYLANPGLTLSENYEKIMSQKLAPSHHERSESENLNLDEDHERGRISNVSFDEENRERGRISNVSFDEENRERGRISNVSFDEENRERGRISNVSFYEENHERGRISNVSFYEENHRRARTADLSFDEETFQSLPSETGSLRDEEI